MNIYNEPQAEHTTKIRTQEKEMFKDKPLLVF